MYQKSSIVVFTQIDGCISNGYSFGRYNSKDLENLREEFNALMGAALDYNFQKNKSNMDYVNDFADYINNISRQRTDDDIDRICVITTNWDIILDQALKRSIDISHPDKLSVVMLVHGWLTTKRSNRDY